ncbi:hypothetical protein Tco_0652502 [Tanacetum coccineum]|uniref:Uncharacterized protein n=1 Tax=Tanacetum coccineum TaxID=301880 RepID=A0ABQ4WXR1_9ASTR
MPYSRFTKLIDKYILSKNDQISKRPLSFHHVIKLDSTLGNLKFANKGTKDLVFGMVIPAMMLNDNIKAFAEYLEYLIKSKGSNPVKAIGIEIAEDVDSEETDEEPPVRRPTGVVIGGEVRSELEDEGVDHLKKLKGLETLSEAAQCKLYMKKEVLDEPSDHSSSSSSEGNEQAGDAQAEVHASECQSKKPKATKVSSSLTLSSVEFTSQFLNDNLDVIVNEVLKDPVKPEVQSMVDVSVIQAKLAE